MLEGGIAAASGGVISQCDPVRERRLQIIMPGARTSYPENAGLITNPIQGPRPNDKLYIHRRDAEILGVSKEERWAFLLEWATESYRLLTAREFTAISVHASY